MYIGLRVKYSLFLFNFNISGQFFEKKLSNFMKIRPMGADMFHADRWTDMTKLIVVFCNFAKTPNKEYNSETCT